MAGQIVPLENLADYITQTILAVKKGAYDAMASGQVDLELPGKIDFTVVVVGDVNAIDRTQTSTPSGAKTTTNVDSSHVITEVTAPATTQSTTQGTGGSDSTHEHTDYEFFDDDGGA